MNLLYKLALLFLLPISLSAAEHAQIDAMRAKIKASIQQHRASTMIKQTREQSEEKLCFITQSQAEFQENQRKYIEQLITRQECRPSIIRQQARLDQLRSGLERITRKQPVIVKQRFAGPLLPRLARLKASAMHLTLPVEDVQAICYYIDGIAIAEYPKLPVEQVWNAW